MSKVRVVKLKLQVWFRSEWLKACSMSEKIFVKLDFKVKSKFRLSTFTIGNKKLQELLPEIQMT